MLLIFFRTTSTSITDLYQLRDFYNLRKILFYVHNYVQGIMVHLELSEELLLPSYVSGKDERCNLSFKLWSDRGDFFRQMAFKQAANG